MEIVGAYTCDCLLRFDPNSSAVGAVDFLPQIARDRHLRHMMKNRRSTVPSVSVAVLVPAITMVGCPVAGRVSPASSLADLHRGTKHGVGLTIAIVSPRGTSVKNLISFYRNDNGSIMDHEPS